MMPTDDAGMVERVLESDLQWLFSGDLFAWLSALLHAT